MTILPSNFIWYLHYWVFATWDLSLCFPLTHGIHSCSNDFMLTVSMATPYAHCNIGCYHVNDGYYNSCPLWALDQICTFSSSAMYARQFDKVLYKIILQKFSLAVGSKLPHPVNFPINSPCTNRLPTFFEDSWHLSSKKKIKVYFKSIWNYNCKLMS